MDVSRIVFTRQLVDAYLFSFFTTRILSSQVIHRGLSGGELVLKDTKVKRGKAKL
jgi:hypothetical protein